MEDGADPRRRDLPYSRTTASRLWIWRREAYTRPHYLDFPRRLNYRRRRCEASGGRYPALLATHPAPPARYAPDRRACTATTTARRPRLSRKPCRTAARFDCSDW